MEQPINEVYNPNWRPIESVAPVLQGVARATQWASENIPGFGGAMEVMRQINLIGRAMGISEEVLDEIAKTHPMNAELLRREITSGTGYVSLLATPEERRAAAEEIERNGPVPDYRTLFFKNVASPTAIQTYEERTPPAAQMLIGFIDPSNLALELPGKALTYARNTRALKNVTKALNVADDLPSGADDAMRMVPGAKGSKEAEEAARAMQQTLSQEGVKAALQAWKNEFIQETRKEIGEWFSQRAAPYRRLEYSYDNWLKEFGEDWIVNTPLGKAKLRGNQYEKLERLGREGYFGLIKPTLQDPLLIVRDDREGILFIKSFAKGTRQVIFVSVTLDRGDAKLVISSGERELKQVVKKIRGGEVLYLSPPQSPGINK